jgi:hypothetical protein
VKDRTLHFVHNYVGSLKGQVPVDGFWSISVYNDKGFFVKNDAAAYTLNNITAKKDADGSVTVQFGGCDGKAPDCLPIFPGWNYMVRLYRPRADVLNGSWTFPQAQRQAERADVRQAARDVRDVGRGEAAIR